jgi:hypothetical protein
VGQNHTAVFETSTDISASQLDFKLYQLWGGAHNLGRFRLSYTTDDRSTFADGLNSGGDVTANWTVLTGATISGTGGETFTVLGDNSILVSGNNPATTVFSLSFSGSFSGITGIRLEALSDASLPFSGPGRQANGNFTLTEITLDATLNESPTANAGGLYSGNEGSAISLAGATASDPDGDTLTFGWTVDSTLCSFDDASALNPNLTCSDNGSYTATLSVDDGVNPAVTSDAAVTVDNVAPTLGAISVDQVLVPVNTVINASADFTDPGTLDTHTAVWDWGDGTRSARSHRAQALAQSMTVTATARPVSTPSS